MIRSEHLVGIGILKWRKAEKVCPERDFGKTLW